MKGRMDRWAARIDALPIGPIAGLALGGALAFFLYAMPMWLVQRLVVESGLPALIAAAEPPLGMTARLSLAGSAGLAIALATWALFAWLDRVPASIPIHSETRSRRADLHPDAPLPRPLFAESELGAPAAVDDDVLDLSELMVAPQAERRLSEEIALATAPAAEPDEAEFVELPPEPVAARQSVSTLMARLESGLVRRTLRAQKAADPLPPPPAPPPAAVPMDDALREALGELRRMAMGR